MFHGLQTPKNICIRYRSRHVADTPSASFQYHSGWPKVWSRKNDTLMLVNEVSIVSQEYMYAVPGSKVSRCLLTVSRLETHVFVHGDSLTKYLRINLYSMHQNIYYFYNLFYIKSFYYFLYYLSWYIFPYDTLITYLKANNISYVYKMHYE